MEDILYAQVLGSNWENVKLLIQLGVVFKNKILFVNSLDRAAQAGGCDIFELLIKNNVINFDKMYIQLQHILLAQAKKNNWTVVKLLIDNNLVNKQDEQGHTVLYYAAQWEQWDMVNSIINAGANFYEFQAYDFFEQAKFLSPQRNTWQFAVDIARVLTILPIMKTFYHMRLISTSFRSWI